MHSKIIEGLVNSNRSELTGLFSDDHSKDLIHNLTSLKEEHPQDSIIGLIWCYVQATNNVIPISFIAGSISEKFSSPEIIQSAPDLCSHIYLQVANLLQAENEHRLCLLLLEPLLKEDSILGKQEKSELHNTIKKSIKVEILEAPLRKEDKSYIQYIDELNKTLSSTSVKSNHNKTKEVDEPSDKTWELDSDTTLDTETILSEATSSLIGGENEIRQTKVTKKNHSKFNFTYLVYGIILIAVIGLVTQFGDLKSRYQTLATKFSQLFSSQTTGTLYSMNLPNQKIDPYLPPLPPYSSLGNSNKLDSISERLSNIQTQESSTEVKPSPTITAEIEVDKDEIESLNVIPDAGTNIPSSVNIPLAKAINVPQPIDLGNSEKGAPIQEMPERKADGKLYTPPSTTDPVAGKSTERALDGSSLKSYEVEKFDPPELYKTITGTNVLSAPSLMSPSIGRLNVGATVRVTSIMGQWTEIRSEAGRLGYIFLKDLKKEEQSLD